MEPERGPAEGLTLLGRDVRGPLRALETFPAPGHVTWVTLKQAVRGGITNTARAEVGSPERC